MFGSFFKKKNNSFILSLVLDIRSSSIGGSVIKIYSNGSPVQILSSHRDFFFFDQVVDADTFINRAEISLRRVLEQLVHKQTYESQIQNVRFFYGAPWYKSIIDNYKTVENEPIVFSKSRFKNIIQKDFRKVEEDQQIIDKELLAVFLNGYYTKSPFNKTAKSIDLSCYIAVINKNTKDIFESTVRKYIRTRNFEHHSHTIAFYNLLKHVVHPPQSYVMFDISGEVTEISVIKNEHLVKIVSVPHGNNYFVRQLMQKNMHDFMTCFGQIKNQPNIIKEISKTEWSQNISESLLDAGIHSLPSTVYISTAEETRDLVKEILGDIDVYFATLKMHTRPDLIFIGNSLFKKRIQYSQSSTRDDAHMMANILYVELISKSS